MCLDRTLSPIPTVLPPLIKFSKKFLVVVFPLCPPRGIGDPAGDPAVCACMDTRGLVCKTLLLDFLGSGAFASSVPTSCAKNSSSLRIRCGADEPLYASLRRPEPTFAETCGRSKTAAKSVTVSSFYVETENRAYRAHEQIVDEEGVVGSRGDEEFVARRELGVREEEKKKMVHWESAWRSGEGRGGKGGWR